MLAFILLASRLGRPVSAIEVANCTHYDLPELHFEPDQYIGWHSQDRRLYFFGWQAFAEIGQMGSHWHVDGDGLTAFSGLPFPADGGWKPGVSWAKQLADRVATTHTNEVADSLAGAFTLVHLPFAGDGIVTTDLMSSGALYSDSSQELLVISNRANLVPIAFSGTAKGAVRDWRGPGWAFFSRQPFSTETGYKDVSALEQSHFVDLPFKRRPAIKARLRPGWDYPEDVEPPKNVAETVERVDAYLRGVTRSVAALPFQRREIRLSGGKDSRVLLALAHAEGLADKFSLLTYGLPESRDVRTAIEIAHAIDMAIDFDERIPMSAADFERQARVHAFQVSGTGSPWDIKGGVTAYDELRISGAMSSAMRIVSITRKLMESSRDPHAVLREGGFNPHGLLLPEIERYYQNELDSVVENAVQQLPDASRYGLLHTNLTWNRRWTGPNVEISPQPWLYPFFAPEIWRAAMVLPVDEVLAERFCFDVLRKAAPELTFMPFVGGAWLPNAYSGLQEADRYAAMRPVASGASHPLHWRVAGFAALLPVFRDYLLDPTNSLYEIVSYERMTELLEAPNKSYSVVQALYDLLGVAIWMAQDELGERIHRADEVGIRGPIDAVESAPRVRLEPDGWNGESVELTPRYPETDHLLHSHMLLEHPQGPLLRPDASVLGVIPYFQAESYLADAIESLLQQSRPLQGIVIIDDCSQVPPTELLARYPGVTLLRAEENSGPYRLIQEVIDNTRYDAYLFQDADDWSTPYRLEVLLDLAVRTGKELVGSQGHRLIVNEGEVVLYQHPLDPAASLATTPKSKPVHHPTSLVSRDLIQRVGGFSTGLPFSGDTEFLRRAATVGQIANTAEFTYVYRTRSDSLTGSEETGVHTPVRRELWAIQHPRAQWIADRVNAGLDPVLLPMAVTSPVRLQHLSGPRLLGFEDGPWPEPVGEEPSITTYAEHLVLPAAQPCLNANRVPRPIFVIGAPRSGTSILALAIAQIPGFKLSLDPTWLLQLSTALHVAYSSVDMGEAMTDLEVQQVDAEEFAAHFGASAHDMLLRGVNSAIAPPLETGFAGPRSEVDRHAARRVVAEGETLADRAFDLYRIFPHADFIHVVRDPDEVVASFQKDRRHLYRSRFVYLDEQQAYERWIQSVQAARDLEVALGAEKVMRVDRSDLLAFPERVMRQVLHFIDEPFDPAVLRPFV